MENARRRGGNLKCEIRKLKKRKRCVAIEIVDKTSSLLGNGNL